MFGTVAHRPVMTDIGRSWRFSKALANARTTRPLFEIITQPFKIVDCYWVFKGKVDRLLVVTKGRATTIAADENHMVPNALWCAVILIIHHVLKNAMLSNFGR